MMDPNEHTSKPPPTPLSYSQGPTEPPGSLKGRMVIGFFAYALVSIAWFVFGSRAVGRAGAAWTGWFFITLLMLGVALYARLRFRRAGYGYGILIGIFVSMLLVVGLILLLIGLCFKGLK